MPQGSVLGLLLFLLYINDLCVAIKYCKVHHFADDTNLLIINKSLKRSNKLLNVDLKNIMNWLKGAEATCEKIARDMKKCFKLKDMLNFNVL